MPKRAFSITDAADRALESFKRDHPGKTYRDIVSDALVQYSIMDQRNYAENLIEQQIVRRFQSMENGLRSLVAAQSIDVLMILMDVLDQRRADGKKNAKEDYDTLRSSAVKMFNARRGNKDQSQDGV